MVDKGETWSIRVVVVDKGEAWSIRARCGSSEWDVVDKGETWSIRVGHG